MANYTETTYRTYAFDPAEFMSLLGIAEGSLEAAHPVSTRDGIEHVAVTVKIKESHA